MRARLLVAVAAAATTLALAACADSGPTGPQKLKPSDAAKDDIECRIGYHIATRADGTQECVPD